jgi:hypothetical protein
MVRALLIAGFLLTACAASEAEPGLRATLRVSGGTFVEGAFPAPNPNGPLITSLRIPHAEVSPSLRRERFSGSVPPDAEAVLIGLRGDPGYWIVGAGAAAIEEPDLPTFSAEISFARDTPAGPLDLALSAVRRDGVVGPRTDVALNHVPRARSEHLSIELHWDTQADIDLHVVVPGESEIWPGNINSYTPPAPGAAAPDPTAFRRGGVLDLDSNGNCVLDGRREERASWETPPMPGTYVVRVATASLCSESIAHWTLEVWKGGVRTAVAQGISQDTDTRFGAGAGAGVLALELTVP